MLAMSHQIIQLLSERPNLNSLEIAQAINAKDTSVKVTLHKLIKREKLVREKVARAEKTKAGPQNLYAYRVVEVKSQDANTQNG